MLMPLGAARRAGAPASRASASAPAAAASGSKAASLLPSPQLRNVRRGVIRSLVIVASASRRGVIVIPPFAAVNVELGIRKLPNGAAPAWSGWTKELLSAACKVDNSLYTDMGVFVAKLQSCGDMRLRQFVRTGKMIALNNAKSEDDLEVSS